MNSLFDMFIDEFENNAPKLDLSKIEDKNKAIELVNTIFDNPFISLFADKSLKNEIIQKINEEHNRLVVKNYPQRFVLELTTDQLNRVYSLTTEYVENVIRKNLGNKLTNKQYDDIENSLIDYSAWLLKHE